MASNPMQKKARNSFLLGMIITLVICAIIGCLFYFILVNPQNKKEKEERGEEVLAYVLKQDVKSGQTITSDMFNQITVYSNMIPNDYINNSQISKLTLQDLNGNILYTNSEGKMYIEQKDSGNYNVIGNKDSDKVKIEIKKDSSGYYKTKTDGEKEYIEFINVPVVAKVDLKKNSVLTASLISKNNQITTDDVRYVEYNMLVLPTTLAVGDYIDIRLTLPNGQDLIVVSKKEVKSLLGKTIGLELSEGDILMMDSAIVEAYIMTAAKLYAIQYVEPGNQMAAVKTYSPTEAVEKLIAANSNITNEAKNALQSKFISGMRDYINNERNTYVTDEQENLETKLKEEIENAKAAREAYLSGLTSY